MAQDKRTAAGYFFTKTLHADTYPVIDSSTKSDLSGKYVFITGASKGIGRMTAISYAKAGAAGIGLAARSANTSLELDIQVAAKQAGKGPPKTLFLELDISEREKVERAAKEVEKTFGCLDILINNAGTLPKNESIADSDPLEWWRTWTNINGTYLMTRSFLPLMLKGGDKQIINITSIGAFFQFPTFSSYQTGKLAMLRFTEFINAEYSEQGVVAFCLHPGGVLTDMAATAPQWMLSSLTDKPELAADTIVHLTREKQTWLAGRYVSCTWDMTELFAMKDHIIERDLLKVRLAI